MKTVIENSTTQEIWEILNDIPDPEVPAINIVELGVVRNININNKDLEIVITPTYSGCPAMKVIEEEIYKSLYKHGFTNVKVKTIFSPSWTSDWLSEEAKLKLKNYGIAPPDKTSAQTHSPFSKLNNNVGCPFCDSMQTELKSQFGSTACKALYFCNNCHQPFEHFKCI